MSRAVGGHVEFFVLIVSNIYEILNHKLLCLILLDFIAYKKSINLQKLALNFRIMIGGFSL